MSEEEILVGRSGMPGWVKVGLVFVLLGSALIFLMVGSDAGDALVYSKLVDEVMADPDAYRGRTLRVEGELKQGSIKFRQEPCEWRFTLNKEGHSMDVRFPQCVVPDTFRDGEGLQVTVQGELTEDNGFFATQVIPRCPSKYEMQERLDKGEVMPHAASLPTGES